MSPSRQAVPAFLVAFAVSTAFAQQARVVTPQAPIAPALGQLGAVLQQALLPGPAGLGGGALSLPAGIGGMVSPVPVIQAAPNVGAGASARAVAASSQGRLVVAVPGAALADLPRGEGARKLLILLDRAAKAREDQKVAPADARADSAPSQAALKGSPSGASARDVLRRAATELESMSVERLRSMPVEELNAWSARLLEGGASRAASMPDVPAGSPSRGSAGLLRSAAGRAAEPAQPKAQVPSPTPAAEPRVGAAEPRVGAAEPRVGAAEPASEKLNLKALAGLFSGRSLSIAAFIATTIAYPFAAVPVVGWAGLGILFAFGPMAGIAAGPIAGRLIDKLPTKTAMAINAALTGALQLVLPAFWYFGVLNFGTLLVASLAQGWLLSTVLITEGAFIRRLFPAKYLGPINGLLQINYFAIQVGLGLLAGIGQIVDQWNPFLVFAGAAAVNLLLVVPLILALVPNVAPPPSTAAKAPAEPFLKRNWPGLAAMALGIAVYPLLHSPLPIVAALLFWISRSANFNLVWKGEGAEPMENVDPAAAKGRLKYGMLFLSLAGLLFYPLQVLVLPGVAGQLGGVDGKGLLLGQFLGSLFLGNMLSTSALSKLPEVKIPFTGRTMGLERLVQALVVALAAATSFVRLFPGDLLAAGVAAGATAGLIWLAQRLSPKGWVQFLGAGLSAVWLPFLAWTGVLPFLSVPVAMMLALFVAGMSFGPSFVSLISYFQRSAKVSEAGKIGGIQGSFFNAAISTGIGLAALAASAFTPSYPALLAVLGAAYAAGGLLFWLAPSKLPGLPPTFLAGRSPAVPAPVGATGAAGLAGRSPAVPAPVGATGEAGGRPKDKQA